MDAEVVERREQALLERVPQPQLDRDAVAEPAQHVEAVGSFGGGGEAEQVLRAEVVEQRLVAGGGGVVELVDDDDVELFGVERGDVVGVDRLDRGEDVLPSGRPVAADPELAEGAVAQHVAERGLALLEDLGAVGDEQQAGPVELGAEVAVVERGDDGLAGAGGGDDEVVGVALAALDLEPFEDLALERVGLDLERREDASRLIQRPPVGPSEALRGRRARSAGRPSRWRRCARRPRSGRG